jgi:hypothetical protein
MNAICNNRRVALGLLGYSLFSSARCAEVRIDTNCLDFLGEKVTDRVVLILVDLTAKRTATFIEQSVKAVMLLCRTKVRVLIWAFAGSASAVPALLVDEVLPSEANEAVTRDVILKGLSATRAESRRRAECQSTVKAKAHKSIEQNMRNSLGTFDHGRDGSSPIIAAINYATAPFLQKAINTRVDVFIFTDALEHVRPGLSLYQPGAPTEKVFLSEAQRLYPGSWAGMRFHLAGIAMGQRNDIVEAERLRQLWGRLIEIRSGTAIEITPSVPQQLD